MAHTRPLVGVSACLMGQAVRFDGGHKRDPFLVDQLAGWVEFRSLCPELALGLGTPRETLRLARIGASVHLVAPRSGLDHTQAMAAWSRTQVAGLGDLDGFVLKKGSPSCGLERVRVYDDHGVPDRSGQGIFAQALTEAWPGLPVEEEGRLHDPLLREHFLTRVFALRRLRDRLAERRSTGALVDLQSREKLLLMAHDPEGQKRVGRLVAGQGGRPGPEAFLAGVMAALARRPSRGRHANVLRHVLGYFRGPLEREARHELGEAIDAYEAGEVGRAVPLTLAAHFVRRTGQGYLAAQTYLDPYPRGLAPRAPL